MCMRPAQDGTHSCTPTFFYFYTIWLSFLPGSRAPQPCNSVNTAVRRRLTWRKCFKRCTHSRWITPGCATLIRGLDWRKKHRSANAFISARGGDEYQKARAPRIATFCWCTIPPRWTRIDFFIFLDQILWPNRPTEICLLWMCLQKVIANLCAFNYQKHDF